MTVERAEYAAFLAALERGLSVTGAAAAAGIDRGLVYRWREEDPDFAAAWRMAAQAGADLLEDEALRRAMEGVEKPVYYRGEQVGTVRTYNDRLLMWLLQRRRPAPDMQAALDESDARATRLANELAEAHQRIAQLNRELKEMRGNPAGAVPGSREETGREAGSAGGDARHDGTRVARQSAAPPADSPSLPASNCLKPGAMRPSLRGDAGPPSGKQGILPCWVSGTPVVRGAAGST